MAGGASDVRGAGTQDLWPYSALATQAILKVAPADKEIGFGTRMGFGGLWTMRSTIIKMGAAAASRKVNTGRRVSFRYAPGAECRSPTSHAAASASDIDAEKR